MFSHHLQIINQTYSEHLNDCLFFSFESFKCSVIFFVHGIIPDIFLFTGSNKLNKLHKILQNKKSKIKNYDLF